MRMDNNHEKMKKEEGEEVQRRHQFYERHGIYKSPKLTNASYTPPRSPLIRREFNLPEGHWQCLSYLIESLLSFFYLRTVNYNPFHTYAPTSLVARLTAYYVGFALMAPALAIGLVRGYLFLADMFVGSLIFDAIDFVKRVHSSSPGGGGEFFLLSVFRQPQPHHHPQLKNNHPPPHHHHALTKLR